MEQIEMGRMSNRNSSNFFRLAKEVITPSGPSMEMWNHSCKQGASNGLNTSLAYCADSNSVSIIPIEFPRSTDSPEVSLASRHNTAPTALHAPTPADSTHFESPTFSRSPLPT